MIMLNKIEIIVTYTNHFVYNVNNYGSYMAVLTSDYSHIIGKILFIYFNTLSNMVIIWCICIIYNSELCISIYITLQVKQYMSNLLYNICYKYIDIYFCLQ